MKTVALLMREHRDGHSYPYKVFLNKEAADRYVEEQNALFQNGNWEYYYWIDEIELDETT